MKENDNNTINRREFLRRLGLGTAAASTALLAATGCRDKGRKSATGRQGQESGEMTYRTNPTTGDRVSLLGFGMMRLPFIGGGNEGDIDQEMVNSMIDYALEHGVNYFDTSPAYCQGKSERATGIALKRHPRDKYFIATKLSNFAPSTWSREASIEMYRNSFKELQVDYIDYMLLHGIGMGGIKEFEQRYIDNGILDFLLEERKAGRIRNLGFSYHGKYAKQINPRNTNAEYLYGELEKRGIPAVIMEPLLGGRLSNVPDNIAVMLKKREPERSVASWAFRFAGTYPGILTVLSGMTRMEHLQDNLGTYCPLDPLTDEEFALLQQAAAMMMEFGTIPCNDCKYCMPCPYGLDIPAILLHYNKCINEGNIPASRQNPNYRKARRAFLIGYDRSVPKLRQASHCIGCNQCTPHCPQGILIPVEMQKIDQYVEKLKQETL